MYYYYYYYYTHARISAIPRLGKISHLYYFDSFSSPYTHTHTHARTHARTHNTHTHARKKSTHPCIASGPEALGGERRSPPIHNQFLRVLMQNDSSSSPDLTIIPRCPPIQAKSDGLLTTSNITSTALTSFLPLEVLGGTYQGFDVPQRGTVVDMGHDGRVGLARRGSREDCRSNDDDYKRSEGSVDRIRRSSAA